MTWKEIIKSRQALLIAYDIAKKKVAEEVEMLIEHPDYDLEETIFKIDKQLYRASEINENTGKSFVDEFAKKILRGEIHHIEPGDRGGIFDYIQGEKYEGELTDSLLTDATKLLNDTWALFRTIYMRMADFKSREFLREVSKTFGVVLDTSPHNDYVRFRHKGLNFELNKGGIGIEVPRAGVRVEICVRDERSLPLGDFYATMLGYIVGKPSALDVIDFGIQLALIMLRYGGYDWFRAVHTFEDRIIGIFTPFEGVNLQNSFFHEMIDYIEKDDHDLAPDILEEIKGALEDCFGSTRGFF